MRERQFRTALEQNGSAFPAGDLDAESNTYQANSVREYPESGERIHGKENLKSLRGHHLDAPVDLSSAVSVVENLWVTDRTVHSRLLEQSALECQLKPFSGAVLLDAPCVALRAN
jgi:hypothetical protein